MRYIKHVIFSAALLVATGSLSALPIGNPSEASLLTQGVFCEGHCPDWCDPCISWCDAWSVRVGYYGDFVHDRNLVVDDHDQHIRRTEMYTDAAYLALNIYDRVDLFATLGATYFKLRGTASVFGDDDDDLTELSTQTDFSWSIGLRATLWDCKCFAVGAETQYFSANPDVNNVHDLDNPPVYLKNESFNYGEWQVGIGASYWINMCSFAVVPYVGIKWATVNVSLDAQADDGNTTVNLRDLENDRCFGYAVGFTLVGCRKFAFTLEKRFTDEDAYYVNAQFRY